MLIHISPRLLVPAGFSLPCELIDIRIKEFDLQLTGGRDAVARQPFPNKRYYVACRKKGRRAINGLLIEVPGHVPVFTVITRWSIGAEVVLRHQVRYVVLDEQFEAVTDYKLLWCERFLPILREQKEPVLVLPFMELMRGNIVPIERREVFRLMTLKAEQLQPGYTCVNERLPSRDMAFQVKTEEVQYG